MAGTDPFNAIPFVDVEVLRVDGDHLDVEHDGRTRRFAIGHLPAVMMHFLVPGARIGVHIATGNTLNFLGPIEGEAIDDMRDPDPRICPVALNVVREHAPDPEATLRAFLASAALLGGVTGVEASRIDGGRLAYSVADRTLMIEQEWDGGMIEADGVLLRSEIPETVANGAAGMSVTEIVDHPSIRGTDAKVVSIRVRAGTTRINWETKGIRVRDLSEMKQ